MSSFMLPLRRSTLNMTSILSQSLVMVRLSLWYRRTKDDQNNSHNDGHSSRQFHTVAVVRYNLSVVLSGSWLDKSMLARA